jgi:para-aminobenzoate synthetase component 1
MNQMGGGEFWMGGRHATGLQEISNDPSSLADGNFWAVSTSFEGKYTFARFANVSDQEFVSKDKWEPLQSTWSNSISKSDYEKYVETIREEISLGNVYQVNACRRLSTPLASERKLGALFAEILSENPAPYASYLDLPGIQIASASPELFLDRSVDVVKTSPIKGTKHLGAAEFGEKDASENIMIVDLMRNDLGRICESGSVQAGDLLRNEAHPGLEHLVSDVYGRLRKGISWSEIFTELSPAGSISGTPKYSAIQIITEQEPTERGPYCGLLGWIEGDRALLSVAIRIFWHVDDALHFGTGAGITWDSDPSGEWEETELKAERLLRISGGERS